MREQDEPPESSESDNEPMQSADDSARHGRDMAVQSTISHRPK
jgi:hypothetical protein